MSATQKRTIPVIGMMCAACSANVERRLSSLKGVVSASVSLPGRTALVEYQPDVISLSDMKREISAIGYDLVVETDRNAEELEHKAYLTLRNKVCLSCFFAIAVMAISMFYQPAEGMFLRNLLLMVLTAVGMFYCGRQFYTTAWQQLRHRSANMDTLVALSTSISFLFSVFNTFCGDRVWTSRGVENNVWYDASIMIIAFVLTGRLLEERAKGSTASAIRSLMGLTPKTARLIVDGNESDVPLSTIQQRDMLRVLQGDKVPVDGIVRDGEAYIDESMISGEPVPVFKQKGTNVLAGTIVKQGSFIMRASSVGEQTFLAGMIRMVEQAQASKAPVQRTVDKVALVFVPVVVGISLLTFILWLAIGGFSQLPHALLSAVSVLVIACPCALGLATPTALMVGIGKAAQHNILVKDATALEQLHKVSALVIDKTGTLTIPNFDIAQSPGQQSLALPFEERESLKPHAREAIEMLQDCGVDVYMMSGDRDDAAHYWADQAGIRHYRSQVLPQDKENLVRQLQSQGHCVAMVGDGVNDSQALAIADVSIAMGRGTDVAMDVAQVTLMGDDLRRIPEAIRLSSQTVRTVRQNLFWAFIYNVICIPLAAGALAPFIHFQITPMWASALMAFSSVSVVLNSLRLKLKK
ncbi:MAG: heavy metal translocating P-type ATPase [Bacteroidales bacterium]|nr:heavy metal translocating P-type ATPase [Bacteroidales bacterium]